MSLADDSAKRYSLLELQRRPFSRSSEIQANDRYAFTAGDMFTICDGCNRHEEDRCLCADAESIQMIHVAPIKYKKGAMPVDYVSTRYSLIELGTWTPADTVSRDIPLRISNLELHPSGKIFHFCACWRPDFDDCTCNEPIDRNHTTYAHVNWYNSAGEIIVPTRHVSRK